MNAGRKKTFSILIFRYLIICLMLIISDSIEAQSEKINPARGTVIDSILCIDNHSQSYSLFLPENYEESVKWPVLFIFDPAARGRMAVERFLPGGKKFGYILVCSNNVRNGNSSQMLINADIMYHDVKKRFKIDEKRILTAGFSGGSRLATAFSINNEEVSGVIGCGAGMPGSTSYPPSSMSHLIYFGIVGIKDMNYLEMISLSSLMTDSGILSYFLIFNGEHEWPSTGNLEFAIGWFELQMMKKGVIKKKNNFLKDYSLQMISVAREAEASSDLVSAKKYYTYALRDLPDSSFRKDLMLSIRNIEKNESYKKAVRNFDRINKQELLTREKCELAFSDIALNKEFSDSSIYWWKNEIQSLNYKIRSHGSSDSSMAFRLINMITVASYEYGKNFINAKNYKAAARFFSIWTMCEPEKKTSWYSLARAYAFDEQYDKALVALEKSIKYGMSDKKSVSNDPAFQQILKDKRFIKSMNMMK